MLDEDLEEPHEQNQKILYNHGQTICLSTIPSQQEHTYVHISGATGWPLPAPLRVQWIEHTVWHWHLHSHLTNAPEQGYASSCTFIH